MKLIASSLYLHALLTQIKVSRAIPHQAYLDVEPVDTARFLDIIRAVNISKYRLSYERSGSNRMRIGAIGSELASIMPEAVDLVPKRVLPPLEQGGEPVILRDIPVVNEQTLFTAGVGATKELISKMDALSGSISGQIDQVADLFGEMAKLEHLISQSSVIREDLEMKSSITEAKIAKFEFERETKRFEEEAAYLETQRQMELERIKQNEELTISRMKQEGEAAEVRAREELKRKFEASRRIEQSRNDAAAELSNLQLERDIALQKASEEMAAKSAKAIAQAKADAERANEDVHIRKLKAEAEQTRKKNIAAINAIASHIATSLHSASKNPRQVLLFICYLAILATGIYTSRELSRLCRVIIESNLGKPRLIRETTRKNFVHELFSHIFLSYFNFNASRRRQNQIDDCFGDVALELELKEKILSIATSSSKVQKNNAPHRHILFFGPPGTGKTMVARKMAKCIGMDYALMSGGDVGPLGSDAVTQIHNLFRWAKFSRKGVLLFIDEAEAFLSDRSKNSMSEQNHNALNALLYNTGSERRDFMMVLATNRAEDLDAAILDRCDESLLFPLPDETCRYKLVKDYYQKFVFSMVESNDLDQISFIRAVKGIFQFEKPFKVSLDKKAMNEPQVQSIVKATAGFSGREIAKLMIALQGAIYASSDGVLTSNMIDKIVASKVQEHKVKLEMTGRSHENQKSTPETKRIQSNNKPRRHAKESANKSTQHLKNAEKSKLSNRTVAKDREDYDKSSTERTASLEESVDDLSFDENSYVDDDENISCSISDLSCSSSDTKELP